LNTIILEDFGVFLGKKSERFTVKKKGVTIAEFPATEVDRIIISSSGATVSSAALHLAVENRVPVAFTYRSGHPFGFLTPTIGHGTVLTRRSQYLEFGSELATELAKGFVIGKLRNQKRLLKVWARTRTRTYPSISDMLYKLSEQVSEKEQEILELTGQLNKDLRLSIMNLEGLAASAYWTGVSEILPPIFGFTSRVTRGAKDPFNMILNYGYGILYSEVWSCVTRAGLDPYAGFLHVDRPGRPSLVLDVIEEFRQQVVDRPVISNFIHSPPELPDFVEDNELSKTARQTVADLVIGRLSTRVQYGDKKSPLRNIMMRQAWNVSKFLKKEVSQYKPFFLKW
jgi:CRISPR-associated protein Cas1